MRTVVRRPIESAKPVERRMATGLVIVVAQCALAALPLVACKSNSGPNTTSTDPTPPASKPTTPRAPSSSGETSPVVSEGAAKATMIVTNESLDVAGKTRSFVLAAPSTYTADNAYPLVLVLHGDGGNGVAIRAAIPFDDVSGQDAIVAYPTGTLGWNLYDPTDKNEDLTFLVELVDSLKTRFTIAPDSVFGMGFSSGAFMVNQVGCRRPSLFRAIVPHSGGAPAEPRDPSATRWENDYTRC